ncbi:hypothetical protein CEY00_Acc11792 [Actinidia chinensis var. chinensis]|uniref:Vacuolar import/degradation Vid27 C-terminal domain-containing protein n=1 Tax=Actinidia chinensis var. chinensis TaxID=1590841 RepID=A0A2R6R3D2_ACTCC|nr:hypothetical protein CEY00_Acc11792 [Actinidia chinensis var. chinensis]
MGFMGSCLCEFGQWELWKQGEYDSFDHPKRAILMRAETNMLLTNPMTNGKPHATGLHQLDIETGKIVSEWRFGNDGTDVTMRDITNDTKGAQMDPSGLTFFGLDDNRLCRWVMRDKEWDGSESC